MRLATFRRASDCVVYGCIVPPITPSPAPAFIATVIGGMGSLVGAVVGGFAVGAVSILLQTLLPSELRPFRDTFVFAFVIVILLVRPQGLMFTRAARERV